jgi:hypothetical protein
MPIAIFNIRTPQSEQFQYRFVNEVADHGKASDLDVSELPLLTAGLMWLGFDRFRSSPAMTTNVLTATHACTSQGRAGSDRSDCGRSLVRIPP